EIRLAEETARLLKYEEDRMVSIAKTNAINKANIRREAQAVELKELQRFVSEKKQANQLSAADEARIWKQAAENFADNLEYRKTALNNFQEAASRVQAEIARINEELIEKEKQITDEYQKTLQD